MTPSKTLSTTVDQRGSRINTFWILAFCYFVCLSANNACSAGGQVLLHARIMHDYPDQKSVAILQNLISALDLAQQSDNSNVHTHKSNKQHTVLTGVMCQDA